MKEIFPYLSAVILLAWGVAHIVPTRSVVAAFGPLSQDNRINITMEWVAEGLALAFMGVLTALVMLSGGSTNSVGRVVLGAVAGFCILMGVWTFMAGRRSSILPIRLCPLVLALAACLLFFGIAL